MVKRCYSCTQPPYGRSTLYWLSAAGLSAFIIMLSVLYHDDDDDDDDDDEDNDDDDDDDDDESVRKQD